MKTTSPSGSWNKHWAPGWLANWWQRRRLRIAMQHIARLSPEFSHDLGLAGATLDDLLAYEDCGDFAEARRAVLGAYRPTAPGPCASATGP